jgi:hypothetical protein
MDDLLSGSGSRTFTVYAEDYEGAEQAVREWENELGMCPYEDVPYDLFDIDEEVGLASSDEDIYPNEDTVTILHVKENA